MSKHPTVEDALAMLRPIFHATVAAAEWADSLECLETSRTMRLLIDGVGRRLELATAAVTGREPGVQHALVRDALKVGVLAEIALGLAAGMAEERDRVGSAQPTPSPAGPPKRPPGRGTLH